MIIDPLNFVGQRYKIKFILIGALGQREIYKEFGKLRNMKVKIIDSIVWSNPVAIPSALAHFDIGLYPLLDNNYNRYKCGFKALEYMAMNIPVVASPVSENKFIIEDGRDGFLVNNQKEWTEKLDYLLGNRLARRKMGIAGREKVEKHYSTQICAAKLREILKKITGY